MKVNHIKTQDKQGWHICSLIVQCLPVKTFQISTALLTIEGAEIYATDQQNGKIIVLMQGLYQRELFQKIESAKQIEGVITILPIYYQQES